jgi:UDP-N-acetylglucosamine 3-dehydrogenase
MTVDIGICGCGFIGRIHARAYKAMPGVSIRAVFDSDPEKARAMAQDTGARSSDSFDALLSDERIEVVSICLPTFLHREHVVRALQAGKHVLCEKPIALTTDDALAMFEAAEQARGRFMVGLTHRFYTENLLVQEAAASGRLGKVLSCSACRLGVLPDWSAGGWMSDPALSGGAATDFIIHDIDLCNWIGGEPRLVMAQGIRSPRGAWDYLDISIDYESGVKGFVEGGWIFKGAWPFTQEHRILGEKGAAQWRSRMGKNIEARMQADSVVGIFVEGREAEYPQWEKRDAFEREVEYFLECVRADKAPEIVRPIDALRALQVSLAARQSAESRRPVEIRPAGEGKTGRRPSWSAE